MEARKNRRQGGAPSSKAELKVKVSMFGPEGFGPYGGDGQYKKYSPAFRNCFLWLAAFANVKLIILSDRKVCKGKREIPRKR